VRKIKEDKEIKLYTITELKKIFHCGNNKIYQIINSSGFPKIKIGKQFYVPKDKLQKWIYINIGNEITI